MAKEKRLFDTDSEEEDAKEYKPSNKTQVESSEEDDDDFEEVEEKPKKVVKKQQKDTKSEGGVEKRKRNENVARNADGHQIFELSVKRRITVRPFLSTGEASVDIREYYQDKTSGEPRPGKAGICLPLAQWNKLVELLPDIEDAIANIPAPAPKASKKK